MKMNLKITALILLMLSASAMAAHYKPEKYYQNLWCSRWNGVQEYKLSDNTRVDCLTKNYAVEFDFASKWAEGLGQALHYARMTQKTGAVILILENPSDFRHYHKLEPLAKQTGVKLWYMKSPAFNENPTQRNYVNVQTTQQNAKELIKYINYILK